MFSQTNRDSPKNFCSTLLKFVYEQLKQQNALSQWGLTIRLRSYIFHLNMTLNIFYIQLYNKMNK